MAVERLERTIDITLPEFKDLSAREREQTRILVGPVGIEDADEWHQVEAGGEWVLDWLKTQGDAVVAGEPVAALRGVMETVPVPAPADGVLAEIRARHGRVRSGDVLGVIAVHGTLADYPEGLTPRLVRNKLPSVEQVSLARALTHPRAIVAGVRSMFSSRAGSLAPSADEPRRPPGPTSTQSFEEVLGVAAVIGLLILGGWLVKYLGQPTPKEWTGHVYPDATNLTRSHALGTFDSLEACRADATARLRALGAGRYWRL